LEGRNEGTGRKFSIGGVAIEDIAHERLVFTLSGIRNGAGDLSKSGLAVFDLLQEPYIQLLVVCGKARSHFVYKLGTFRHQSQLSFFSQSMLASDEPTSKKGSMNNQRKHHRATPRMTKRVAARAMTRTRHTFSEEEEEEEDTPVFGNLRYFFFCDVFCFQIF